MTPKFIQIVATATNSPFLYGLTAEGEVWQWRLVYDNPDVPHYNKTHYTWIKCVSPDSAA